MSACGAANVFGWRHYASDPPPRHDLLLQMHNGGWNFMARPCELRGDLNNLWWRLTGIAKEQLERGEYTRLADGELVMLPAGATMGAEMIAPEQRNAGASDAVL